MTSVRRFRRVLRVHVQVLEEAGLGESRFVVDAGASVPVPASPDFEVEGTVDSRTCSCNGALFELRTYLSFSVPKIDAKYSAIFA